MLQHFDELCIGSKSKVLNNINFHWLGLKNTPLNDEFELTPYFFDIRTKFSTLNNIKDRPTRSSEMIVLKLL
jgi:Fe-S-cluster formation regulator IscX/YfhJ